MIRVELAAVSPEQWPDRACLGVSTEVFFDNRGAATARRLCMECPRLRECAEWARSAGLTDCVVASVRMPSEGRDRSNAMAALERVAATGEVAGVVGEAAA